MEQLKKNIRNIPDFPEPGVQFKDITPLLSDPDAMKLCVDNMIAAFSSSEITAVASMEARGFMFGPIIAWQLGVGFIPLRKPGKLPYEVKHVEYDLEYGSTRLEAHIDAFSISDKVLLVDDVLATGGTAKAACDLIESLGAQVTGLSFVLELGFLEGRHKLSNYPIHSVMSY